jgi:hypothetical protein
MRLNSWLWRCLCLAFSIWLAFAIMRAMKRPTVLLVGLCLTLTALGVALEALHS